MPEDTQIDDLDLLFYDRPVDGDLEHIKLVDDPYLLVARPGDLPDGPVRPKRLDGRPMVGCHPTCDQQWMERALADAGARPRIVFRSPGNETILSMVRPTGRTGDRDRRRGCRRGFSRPDRAVPADVPCRPSPPPPRPSPPETSTSALDLGEPADELTDLGSILCVCRHCQHPHIGVE